MYVTGPSNLIGGPDSNIPEPYTKKQAKVTIPIFVWPVRLKVSLY